MVGCQNFLLWPQIYPKQALFNPNFALLKDKFMTRNKFVDSPKFRTKIAPFLYHSVIVPLTEICANLSVENLEIFAFFPARTSSSRTTQLGSKS